MGRATFWLGIGITVAGLAPRLVLPADGASSAQYAIILFAWRCLGLPFLALSIRACARSAARTWGIERVPLGSVYTVTYGLTFFVLVAATGVRVQGGEATDVGLWVMSAVVGWLYLMLIKHLVAHAAARAARTRAPVRVVS